MSKAGSKDKSQKRIAFMKAIEKIGELDAEYSMLKRIARRLNGNGDDESLKIIAGQLYSINYGRSTPDNSIANLLYKNWPDKEVYELLKDHFAISQETVQKPVEEELLDNLPELINRINQLKAQKRRLEKEVQEAEVLKEKLIELINRLPDDWKRKNATLVAELQVIASAF